VNGETDLIPTGGLAMQSQRLGRRSLVAAGATAVLAMSILAAARTVDAAASAPAGGAAGALFEQSANTASIFIRKNDTNFNHLAGAVFAVEGVPETMTTDANGGACFTGLPQDATLKVTEISPPPGYLLPDPNFQMVHVDNDGDCTSRDVLFVDAKASASQSGSASGSASGSSSKSAESSVRGTLGSPEGSVQGLTGGPGASVPNTAFGYAGSDAGLISVLPFILLLSLSTVAYAFARARRRH
jgi:hypothetical protein